MTAYKTPILFLIFNRPDVTARVFDVVSKLKPTKLYIAADGPRADKEGEAQLCQQTRDVVSQIDWPCEVAYLYREKNLGCKVAVSTAISWFFEHEEEGIILEDDCLPNATFFRFCETMLAKYRNDTRIMHIGGTNFQNGITRGNASYYFSRLCHVWGWATWKRAWLNYDIQLKDWAEIMSNDLLVSIIPDSKLRRVYKTIFETTAQNKINTWDYQWVYSVWKNNGLSIIPNQNLVSNIGFGQGGTHTMDTDSVFANNATTELTEIKHPEIYLPCLEADEKTLLDSFKYYLSLKGRLMENLGKLKKSLLT
ncbi:nucleotide-diphospho-sugar transferase [Chitinophaga flava]|uniref:Nucleotide-diphospho-sugar transferase n=1 Tax=Chitinophaga flava TaxID=2259036 RepID=A0A365Y659_9BACT|nr:nucleotide-diphospho-sugar transferase [Chitinophaga flava]RBL93818.1 nucleotide-diphospho-sugar transferase [Chitinophaga flava]